MKFLLEHDVMACARRLPAKVEAVLRLNGSRAFVAGGFIRSVIAGDPINDVDIFCESFEVARDVAMALAEDESKLHQTSSAFTIRSLRPTTQVIKKWRGPTADKCIESFDFTIAKAAFWWDGEWVGICHDDFYAHIGTRSLVYERPSESMDAGGSLLRLIKFSKLGYSVDQKSLADLVCHVIKSVDLPKFSAANDADASKMVEGLLKPSYEEGGQRPS